MLSSWARELKQQGALEAARDPNSPVTAAEAEHVMIEESKRAGAVALEFNSNASPAEKAAQAESYIPQNFHHEHRSHAAGAVSDADDGVAPTYELAPPTKDGALPPPSSSADGTNQPNGHTPEDDEWARVGWAPRFGQLDGAADEENTPMLDHQTLVETKLDEKYFGDWYHNTGVIIFACLSSWVVAVLGGGLGWVFLIMATCGTYYRTSIRRVRRNYRDDISREMAKARLETDSETLEWINSFMVKFWPIYAPVLCKTIVASVDQVLSTSTPAFLDSLRLTKFVLGTKPPRMEHVKTYPKTEDDIVLMDWKFSFTPNDVADLTARQIKSKINPKVVLEVRIGKGMVSKGLDVIVEDMACSGVIRVKVKLQIPFPHVERVEICFLERPTIDYVCKPLGGDMFGFDINFIPGLETFILEQVHGNLAPIMYAPNVFPIEIAKMLSGDPVDQAIGVLQVTIHGAQGLKNSDKFAGTPDPYVVVSTNGREVLGKTEPVKENGNPRWNQTFNIIIISTKDTLTLQMYDYNEFRKDKLLGTASFPLENIETEPNHENLQLEVMANGKPRGLVLADVRFFPVLKGVKLDDGTEEPPPESNSGIARFTVVQAKDLDGTKSMIGQLNPYAVLLLNGKEVHTSQKLKRTNNPVWTNASKELLITNKKTAKLGVAIKDDRDIAADPIIGTYQIKLEDMLEMVEKGQEWYHLAGAQTGRVQLQLHWRPVALKGGVSASGGYVKPVGVMRLHFKNARDLLNVETMGKSDPYVRVLLSGIEKGRTVTFRGNLNPDWDEVIYVPVHSRREKLILEVMDEESIGKDRSMGFTELAAADYIREEAGEYMIRDDRRVIAGPLRTGSKGTPKGVLNYTCSFFPTYNVVDPDDGEDDEKEKEKPSVNGVYTDLKGSMDGSRDSPDPAQRYGSGTVDSLRSNGDVDLARKLAANEKEQEDTHTGARKVPKIRLTPDNVGEYESGLVVFKLIDCDLLHDDCYIEVLMDDMVFPSYTSSKVRSRRVTLHETGDAMVREIDVSRITLRLVEKMDRKGEGKDEHVLAKLTGNTLDILKRHLYQPVSLSLKDSDGRESKITVNLKYLPVKMRIDPSESINNMGTLRVEVLDAVDLPAADRNGFSDPFCKFILNGREVHKTKTQKKTLHPAWNEYFEVPIASRTAAQFELQVYDWDFGDKSDFLGKAQINLRSLEPFQKQEVSYGLDGKSGSIRLRLLFKPEYVMRSRQGSSTFSGTFAAPGKVIGVPVKGVGKGAVFIGGNVARGASFIGRGFRRRKSGGAGEGAELDEPEQGNSADTGLPSTPQVYVDGNESRPQHQRVLSAGSHSINSNVGGSPGGAELGTASITVVSASGYPPSTNARVHIKMATAKGTKEIHKTRAIKEPSGKFQWGDQESCKVTCAADTLFTAQVKDHSTFGPDDDLGEGIFYVNDSRAGGEQSVKAGNGSVVVRTSFASMDGASTLTSPGRGFRMSFMGGRKERSVAPG